MIRLGQVTSNEERTSLGVFHIVYRDGDPIARISELGKPYGDLLIESAYLSKSIVAPCGRFADLDQKALEAITLLVLRHNPQLECRLFDKSSQ